MKPAAERVQSALRELGLAREVIELTAEARTSQEAAQALGVSVERIAASISA